jgi:serine phosphatase RsbU (regulator of sigma subunit)
MGAVKLGEVEWASAARPAGPGSEMGDAYLVRSVEHGVLIAVVDGLGHGPEAALAAQRALQALERSSQSLPSALVSECHRALQSTRGVVMGIAHVDVQADALTWIGVGDVRAVLHRAGPAGPAKTEILVTHNGVVGRSLPPLRPVRRSLLVGDTVIVATDGVRDGFPPGLKENEPPDRIANDLLQRHSVATDDALVLVARYRGGAA